MTRKIQSLAVDGVPVDLSRARFANTFDVADRDERDLAFDEEVVWVVLARVASVNNRETAAGDIHRVNALKVKEARLLRDSHLRAKVLRALEFASVPSPSLFDNSPPSTDPEPEESVEELEALGVRFDEEDDELNMSGIDLEDEFDDDEEFSQLIASIPNEPSKAIEATGGIVIDPSGRPKFKTSADEDPTLAKFLGV